jgi:MFS family permease
VAEYQRSSGYAWLMVGVSGLIMGMGFGTQVTVSVFLQPLNQEFGWARGDISFAYTLAAFFSGLGALVMGHLADRISPRIQVAIGAVTMGVAYLLLSHATQLWQFYLLYGVLIGGLCQGSFLTPLLTNVGFWFEKHRGIAMGAALGGQSLGAAIVPLVARYLITEFGWRQAYLLMGYGAWAILIPLALLVRQAPGIEAQRTASRALAAADPHGRGGRTAVGFTTGHLALYLGIASILCCILMAIPSLHIVSLALDAGISAQAAASVLTVLMILSIVGRVGIGTIADQIGGLNALWLASFGQTVMIFWFTQVHSLVGMYAVAILYAPAFGGVIPAYAIVIRELVPAHQIGGVLGWTLFLSNIGMGAGGYLGGALFDWTGNYTAPFATGAFTGAINLVMVGWLILRHRQVLAARASGYPAELAAK